MHPAIHGPYEISADGSTLNACSGAQEPQLIPITPLSHVHGTTQPVNHHHGVL